MSYKNFISENFLLQNKTAEKLYHNFAASLPIIDYHNHLNPSWLAKNYRFRNIAEMWVLADPYKHRAMRINGQPETQITGNYTDKEKFITWARTSPFTLGNPLYHWSAMELKNIFDIDEILNEQNADKIWDLCQDKLNEKEGFGAADILQKFNTEVLCTSDDIRETLDSHVTATKNNNFKVFPSLRADSILLPTKQMMVELEQIANLSIKNPEDYIQAIKTRLDYFSQNGCLVADHSLDAGFTFTKPDKEKAYKALSNILSGQAIENELALKNYLLYLLGIEYSKRNWKLLLHIGAQRFTSSRLRKLAGPAGGYAGIGTACDILSLAQFLDQLECEDALPQTIIFTLNPADNEAFATLNGSFSQDNLPVKVQFGPAWWFNDHFEGIEQQLKDFTSYSLLGRFIGMTTDSRSVLSFVRHEYFRRILCNLIGHWAEKGHFPNDEEILKKIIEDISYFNSKNWINNE